MTLQAASPYPTWVSADASFGRNGEWASQVMKMNMQVADVHKGLLSLSRCADMGFERRFGRRAGARICENTGEVIPLANKGNLYVLSVRVRAAPFARPEP